jgi:hypothetical protein
VEQLTPLFSERSIDALALARANIGKEGSTLKYDKSAKKYHGSLIAAQMVVFRLSSSASILLLLRRVN